jgi:hypothetical protein
LGISSPISRFWHFGSHFQIQAFPHFSVTFTTNHKVYGQEEGGGLFPSLGCVSVMKSMLIYDLKMAPFALTTYIVWLVQVIIYEVPKIFKLSHPRSLMHPFISRYKKLGSVPPKFSFSFNAIISKVSS